MRGNPGSDFRCLKSEIVVNLSFRDDAQPNAELIFARDHLPSAPKNRIAAYERGQLRTTIDARNGRLTACCSIF
jgi:hypothetical protein